MVHIVYPTIDLFLYDLRDALGQDPDKVEQNRQQFAQKLPESIQSYIFENDNQFESEEFVELLGVEKPIEPLPLKSKDFEGYYYPVRLSDTYGLLLDCSVADQTKPYPVSDIGKLKQLVEEKLNYQVATLGQTWLISGQLPIDSHPNQNPETIAQECYQALIPNADWERNLQGKGYFSGGTLFEVWRYSFKGSEPFTSKIEDNHHIIIAIYPDATTARKAASLIDDWMRLFCHRSKIIWAYNQSLLLKNYLKTDFIDIQNYIRLLRKKETEKITFKRLQNNLDKAENLFSHYAIDLEYLDYQSNTIEINGHNYCQRLDTIRETSTSAGIQNDLEFLKKFSHLEQNKYLRQIQKDYHNLSKGLKLLEVAVNFIRAEVEVEKAGRDRTFQNTVAILGVGLAAGSFVASVAGQFPWAGEKTTSEQAREYPIVSTISHLGVPDPWLVPTTSIVISLGVAIAAGTLTALVIKLSWLARKLWARPH